MTQGGGVDSRFIVQFTGNDTWDGAPCCHAGDLSLSVCGDGLSNLLHTDYSMDSQCAASFSPSVQSDLGRWGSLNQPSSPHTPGWHPHVTTNWLQNSHLQCQPPHINTRSTNSECTYKQCNKPYWRYWYWFIPYNLALPHSVGKES